MEYPSFEEIDSLPRLGDSNFASWSKHIKAYLIQKKVWAIVKGTDTQPSPGSSELKDWLKDEQLAAGVIYLALEEGKKSKIEDFLDNPRRMWEELLSIHVQKHLQQPPNPKPSFYKPSQQAAITMEKETTQEFAGNASNTSFDSSLPQSTHNLLWCADTGASSHMTPHRAWFDEYRPYSVPVRVANGTVVQSAGIGSVHFRPMLQGVQGREVVFHKVLHVPALQNSLLSVLYLTSNQGFRLLIEKKSMQFEREGVLLFTATVKGKLAYLDGTTLRYSDQSALSSLSTSLLAMN